MKISLNGPKLWLVTDPMSEDSEFIDSLYEGTLQDFINIVRGTMHRRDGQSLESENPTLFTDKAEAEAEARRRFERGPKRRLGSRIKGWPRSRR